jgi:hypothetical protein
MKGDSRKWIRSVVMAVVAMASFSCGNEFTRSASPVELILTNTQEVFRFDFKDDAIGCNSPLGRVAIRAILKNPNLNVDQRFNDVRITRYRISYVRTDGGTMVPAPFVRSIDILISANGADSDLTGFTAFTDDTLAQAPFAALRPENGGRDPETGRTSVHLDIVLEVFGETLAGANVAGRTRMPLEFCYDCNGCA